MNPPPEQTNPRKKLPRGTTSLPKDVAVAKQRARLQQAVAVTVAEKGYVDTTVADIVKAAGVSRATFYEIWAPTSWHGSRSPSSRPTPSRPRLLRKWF